MKPRPANPAPGGTILEESETMVSTRREEIQVQLDRLNARLLVTLDIRERHRLLKVARELKTERASLPLPGEPAR